MTDVGAILSADFQPPILVNRRDRLLLDLPLFAEPAAVRRPRTRQVRLDAQVRDSCVGGLRAVGSIAHQPLGKTVSIATTAAAIRGMGLEHCDVLTNSGRADQPARRDVFDSTKGR